MASRKTTRRENKLFHEIIASSTVLLDLNDDCLYCIFKKLKIQDQMQLVNTCERFHTIIREMIWRNQFQKFNNRDRNIKELNKQEYMEFYCHIAEYIEELDIDYYDTFDLDLNFYLHTQLSRLRCLKNLYFSFIDASMGNIVLNCPNIQVTRGKGITGAHIKNMSNLRELYLPDCSLDREHLRDIFKHLNLTHLDVSGCKKLPLEDTWPQFRWLKVSENHLTADFVKKLSYLRSLENFIVKLEHMKWLFRDWTGLFERLEDIIAGMCHPEFFPKSEFAGSTQNLTTFKKVRIDEFFFEYLKPFAHLPALKEFRMQTGTLRNVDHVVKFIAKAKHLEFLEWHITEIYYCRYFDDIKKDFGWLLKVIENLREQKERPKLCLNFSFEIINSYTCVKVRDLVMEEQQHDTDPLLEVKFDETVFDELATDTRDTKESNFIELYIDRT